jgi:hypothetical protein
MYMVAHRCCDPIVISSMGTLIIVLCLHNNWKINNKTKNQKKKHTHTGTPYH